jgi:hypothetical protein
MVTSLSLWTLKFNSWPAGIWFMVDKGALVQVFLQGLCISWVSIVQPVLHIHSSVTDTAYRCQHDISLRKTEVFMCGYWKCGVCWRKFCGMRSPVKWKCLGMSILSFRLLCRYVEMTGVSFNTYWYGIYVSIDSLRQASDKCIVLCLIEWCGVVTDYVI